jgi:hypothetical protein
MSFDLFCFKILDVGIHQGINSKYNSYNRIDRICITDTIREGNGIFNQIDSIKKNLSVLFYMH